MINERSARTGSAAIARKSCASGGTCTSFVLLSAKTGDGNLGTGTVKNDPQNQRVAGLDGLSGASRAARQAGFPATLQCCVIGDPVAHCQLIYVHISRR